MDVMIVVSLVAGLVGLGLGGELLVRGSAALAGIARISPLVIGLTSSPSAPAPPSWPSRSRPGSRTNPTSPSATSSAATSSTFW